MPSRQDQLHSYQYSMQRVVAALVTHDPDPQRSPMRRAGTTALASLVIAAVAVCGTAVYGIVTGQSDATAKDWHAVLQEKGSGARYVYLRSDEKLHPVLNYTSGLLLTEGQGPQMKSISTQRLASVPLGAPLGIPGAPDSLPPSGSLLTGRWSVCTDDKGAAPRSTLLVGDRLSDGTVAAATGAALLVRDPNDQAYLVFGNKRFAIPAPRQTATLRALGWNDQQPWPVSPAWLDAIPAGPDLTAPPVPGHDGGQRFHGHRVGQLVTDSQGHFGVILSDGMADVTPMQARLLQAAPGGHQPTAVDDFIPLPDSRTTLSDAGRPDALPATVPVLATTPSQVCITLPVDEKTGDGIRIDPTLPRDIVDADATTADGVRTDRVHVPRTRGAVVVSAASPTAPAGSGTVSVVTDTGRRYPLAGRDVLAKLGYGDVTPQPVPAELVALLPEGPALDPDRARRP